jgi:hypothetical protein
MNDGGVDFEDGHGGVRESVMFGGEQATGEGGGFI